MVLAPLPDSSSPSSPLRSPSSSLGVIHARAGAASRPRRYDAQARCAFAPKCDAVRRHRDAADAGRHERHAVAPHRPSSRRRAHASARRAWSPRSSRQLQNEMGLLPVQLLRDRRTSFVELYAYDNLGQDELRHGRLSRQRLLHHRQARRRRARRTTTIATARGDRVDQDRCIEGKEVPAKVVDAGDADVEVHSGDWAIIKTRDRRPAGAARRHRFAYDFADPIFRLGNDYSKGIILVDRLRRASGRRTGSSPA